MVGSPSKKSRRTWNICGFLENCLVTSMVFTIIIPTLSIQSENIDIKMQVRDRHANEHTALKRLGGDFTDRKKEWRCSLDCISKVYRYRHQKSKFKIKFHLYLLYLRWPYCLTIIGCNFVLNDLLHQTLTSYNGPWFTFPFMHIWWHHDDVIRF